MSLQPPPPDIAAGMTAYATTSGRQPGRLRTEREDFQVDEILDLGVLEHERKGGFVPVYVIRKNGIDTPHAAEELASFLKSKVNFAGLKDSNAVTVQYASARSSRADDPPMVQGRMFEAERIGYLPRPISRGMMSGNRFRIVVRSGSDLREVVEEVFRKCSDRGIPNYFGYQRFGLRGMANHRVGRAILLRDFRDAIRIFLGDPRQAESPEAVEARRLAGEGQYEQAIRHFSPRQDIERKVCAHLAKKPDDPLGAIRRIPIVPRRLFVQAYQSYVFNRVASDAIASGLDISRAEEGDNWATLAPDQLRSTHTHGVKERVVEGAVPLIQIVGYGTRDYGSRFDRIMLPLLKEQSLEPKMFYIKEAEELSNEGGFRHAPLLAANLGQEQHPAGVTLTFNLGRGEYATTLLREVLKPEDPLQSGF